MEQTQGLMFCLQLCDSVQLKWIEIGKKWIWKQKPRKEKLAQLNSNLAAKSLQSCPTLCDPTDGSLPGSPVPGILQARTLEWVAISFSKEWKEKVQVKSLSCVRLFATQWIVAYQTPPSMGFSRQEYWSGLPFLPPGDLPSPGIKPRSPELQADALPSESSGKPKGIEA